MITSNLSVLYLFCIVMNSFFFDMTLQMALWSMTKSPLMYGGDLRNLDDSTLNIITNSGLLKINHYSRNNMEVPALEASY
jgi:hypothetical protein